MFPLSFQDIQNQLQKDPSSFKKIALDLFSYQFVHNPVYQNYCINIGLTNPKLVRELTEIPFLPISLFKSHRIASVDKPEILHFQSSGTTQVNTSKHLVFRPENYEQSIVGAFSNFFDKPKDWVFLALLPGYLERKNASLVYMIKHLINQNKEGLGGFYLDNFEMLIQDIKKHQLAGRKIMLVGVTHALLDLFEKHGPQNWPDVHILETGGMKGRRKEIIREELHDLLFSAFNSIVLSEYGMTELFSQAYLINGHFCCPAWMKVLIREIGDPLTVRNSKSSGAINVIDLANMDSCAFIATDDLGKIEKENCFDVLGRLDNSDARGCNLLLS